MPKSIHILGISAFYHDSAACLIKNGEIMAAAQEERFTRKKHDFSFPVNAIKYCLRECGIVAGDLDYVGFYDKPFLIVMPSWLKRKILLKDFIKKELGYDGEIIFTGHHESHASSAFYPSPFERSAILIIDGVGEWATTSFGLGEGNKFELTHELRFPNSLGLLYSAFTYHLGFRVNSGEYKVMGLAPYGKPRYAETIKKKLIDIRGDGSFRLNMRYFNYCSGIPMANKKFDSLFGLPPRRPESEITAKHMDLARSIQDVTGEVMVKTANHLFELTCEKNLCLAGGVALNCVGNGKILRESGFKNIWIQPASGDAGGALGSACFIWYRYLDNLREPNGVRDRQKGSLLGPEFDAGDIFAFARDENLVCENFSREELQKKIAGYIAEGKIVGLFHGRMEFGPRALGNRSIIADARDEKMQSNLNLKIKFRESFRPFAPSVLEENSGEYFELDSRSPYMLLTASVKRRVIPAVTHVDYSARVQTVSEEDNPFYYGIIKAFYDLTRCPVIVNTSFNVRGEPIVCTPRDAYRCFMQTGMDYLVMGGYLFDKKKQSAYHEQL